METNDTGNGQDNPVDLLKAYQETTKKYQDVGSIQQSTTTGQYWSNPSPCPSCGHCPTCGRGGYHTQPYPSYPWITWTGGTGGYVPTVSTGVTDTPNGTSWTAKFQALSERILA